MKNKNSGENKSLYLYTSLIFIVAILLIILAFFGQTNMQNSEPDIDAVIEETEQPSNGIAEKASVLSEENRVLIEEKTKLEEEIRTKDAIISGMENEKFNLNEKIRINDLLLQANGYLSVGNYEKAAEALNEVNYDSLSSDQKIIYNNVKKCIKLKGQIKMLDIKILRQEPEKIKEALKKRNNDLDITPAIELDKERRAILTDVEQKKAKQNEINKQIPQLKKAGENTDEIFAQMREVSAEIKADDEKVREIDEKLREFMLRIPNIPNENVPVGADDSENVEIRKFGEPRKFDFEPKAHWDIGTNLDILDFERGTKIAGTRFTVYKGLGARLERAVIQFFLNTHTENGYTEIFPPYMVNRASMTGTGQLPKFEEDAFKVTNNGFFLIPTAEVPVTNLHRDEILDGEKLPIKYCAYSACFRAEAGSAGRDTRGLIRQHQFNKVELVKFVNPETSYDELEKLTNDAEKLLQLLNIPYRVVCLSTGDLGFSSAKTYDIEVWMPSYGRYVEISSCSNFEDYQARRANIRFKNGPKDKAQFVHTLNGSGLAVGRTVAAILENYQNEDGTITVPQVLVPYMGTDTIS